MSTVARNSTPPAVAKPSEVPPLPVVILVPLTSVSTIRIGTAKKIRNEVVSRLRGAWGASMPKRTAYCGCGLGTAMSDHPSCRWDPDTPWSSLVRRTRIRTREGSSSAPRRAKSRDPFRGRRVAATQLGPHRGAAGIDDARRRERWRDQLRIGCAGAVPAALELLQCPRERLARAEEPCGCRVSGILAIGRQQPSR